MEQLDESEELRAQLKAGHSELIGGMNEVDAVQQSPIIFSYGGRGIGDGRFDEEYIQGDAKIDENKLNAVDWRDLFNSAKLNADEMRTRWNPADKPVDVQLKENLLVDMGGIASNPKQFDAFFEELKTKIANEARQFKVSFAREPKYRNTNSAD